MRDRYEAYHRVSVTDDALVAAAQLAVSSWPGKLMPGKAINLLDEAASMIRIRHAVGRPPADLQQYYEKIGQVRREKESAIDSRDIQRAAALRDIEEQLQAKKASLRSSERAAISSLR